MNADLLIQIVNMGLRRRLGYTELFRNEPNVPSPYKKAANISLPR